MDAHGGHDMPMPMPGDGAHDGHGGGHGGGGMAMKCSMSMVWNTSTTGMCIVFPSWHVTGPTSFVWTLFALFSLAVLLEYLRFRIRSYDANLIAVHRLSNGILHGLTGGASPSSLRHASHDHRRKASVQSILGRSHSPSGKANSIGGPTLSTTATGLHIGGERRFSPSHTPSDQSSFGSRSEDDAPLLPGAYGRSRTQPSVARRLYNAFIPRLPINRQSQIRRAALYVVTLALSVFIMLVFMTYNAWMIGSILLGAGVGHYLFNRDIGLGMLTDDKTACH